jgi:hypothetical protein
LHDAGFLDSNLFSVAGREIEIGFQDVTKQIRIPTRINEDLAWLAGMVSISSWLECELSKNGRTYPSQKSYCLSFQRRDKNILWLEFMPLFEDFFNYSPIVDKKKCIAMRGCNTESYSVGINPRSIVSYFKDVVGIHPKQEERLIPFTDDRLRKAFIGGIIDRCGRETPVSISLIVPSKYPRLATELAEHFARKKTPLPNGFHLHFVGEHARQEKIEEYGLRHPKWFLPAIEEIANQKSQTSPS